MGYTDRVVTFIYVGGGKYRPNAAFAWDLFYKGSGQVMHIPTDWVFDVSIPWWATPILNKKDKRFLAAACLHDRALHVLDWDRGIAGGLFYDALRADGVSQVKAALMAAATMIGKRNASSK